MIMNSAWNRASSKKRQQCGLEEEDGTGDEGLTREWEGNRGH
jgi:hypothetical protein